MEPVVFSLRTVATVVLAVAAGAVLSFCTVPDHPTAGLSPAIDLRSSLETTMPTIRLFLHRLRALLGDAPSTTDHLRDLDAAALADMGIHRSEIGSIEAESHGRADITRRRVGLVHHHA